MTERIKQGMKVEVSDILHPYKLWVATVRSNIQILYYYFHKYHLINFVFL